jgi:hypothetical protein
MGSNVADFTLKFKSATASIKSKISAIRKQGFQDHHIISDKNALTKNHELLELADFDLQSRANKILLPETEALHPTRSIHNGRHTNAHSESIATDMDAIVKRGKELGFGKNEYRFELNSLLREQRQLLKQGEIPLNKNARDWSK